MCPPWRERVLVAARLLPAGRPSRLLAGDRRYFWSAVGYPPQVCCSSALARMSDGGCTETDAIEVQHPLQNALLPMAIKIYRAHWKKTLEVDDCAVMSAKELKAKVDLQPVLHAIVAHAVPMPVHTRVCSEAMDAKLAASLDETKEGDTAKMLEKYRKESRTQDRMRAELTDGHGH